MAQSNRPRVSSGPTVTVACKLPHGLILRQYTMVDTDQPVMGGGIKTVKQAQQLPGEVAINGNAHPQNAGPKCAIVGGYALTPNVDKAFWDRWLEANKDSDMVKNNLIFAHESMDAAQGDAEDKAAVRSNLERLDPKKLPKGLEQSEMLDSEIKKKLAAA
jgi:hypothetical protein